jgi:hypothetical protein
VTYFPLRLSSSTAAAACSWEYRLSMSLSCARLCFHLALGPKQAFITEASSDGTEDDVGL